MDPQKAQGRILAYLFLPFSCDLIFGPNTRAIWGLDSCQVKGCKEMGRERKLRLCGREEVLHLLFGGVEFQRSLNLPFLSPLLLPPKQRYRCLTCNTTQDSVSIFIFVLEKANNALCRSKEENLFFPYSVAILLTEELLALK